MSIETVEPETTSVLDVEVVPYEDTDDGAEHRTHIVRPADNGVYDADDPTTAKDIVDMARMAGTEVVALCGYRWVPKRNPEKYPACEKCFEIAGLIHRGDWR